ncbi:MAG: hypothetical protein JEZ14_22815, partial [Marinilabiliaceae bacterium]|nr:hypothetical protein [Marinilabiliaceae bacterium]
MRGIFGITCLFFLTTLCVAQQKPISISGIYPHLSVFNEAHASERPGETAIGAVVPWAGKLWAITYPG